MSGATSFPADARGAAKYLLENFKLYPIRVDARSKAPSYHNWEKTRLSTASEVDSHFDVDPSCSNLGILWGCGNNDVDVDLDSALAIKLGPAFLPATDMIFGRKSARASHWIYHASATLSRQFIDPIIEAENKSKPEADRKKAMLVEIRGTGGQTVFPPSRHQDTGELIEFSTLGAPGDVDIATLEWSVRSLASCALLARYWPDGGRNHTLMYLIGYLAKFWDDDQIRCFVGSLYSVVSEPADIRQEMEAQIKGARSKLGRQPVGGAGKLKECIDPRVVDKVVEWLNLDESIGPEDILPFEDYDEEPDPIYVVDKFINEGTTEIWFADSGHGKSTLATAIGNAISHGVPFSTLKTTKRPVMLIDGGENPKPAMRHRLKLLGIKQRGDPDRVILWGEWAPQGPTIPNERVTRWVEACEVKPFIIIDSLGKFFDGKSENDNAEMYKFMALMEDWERLGATLLILHNTGRDGRFRGASAILNTCDAMREITARFDNRLIVSMVIKTTKERVRRDDALAETFALKLSKGGEFILMDNLPPSEEQIVLNNDLALLLLKHPRLSVDEFHKVVKDDGLKLGQKKVREWLKQGCKHGLVSECQDGKKTIYIYVGPPPRQTDKTPFNS